MTYKVYARVRDDYRKDHPHCPQFQFIGWTGSAEAAIEWGNHNVEEYGYCYESYKISVSDD